MAKYAGRGGCGLNGGWVDGYGVCEAAGVKTLVYTAINQWVKLMNGLVLLPSVNECWLGTASKNN